MSSRQNEQTQWQIKFSLSSDYKCRLFCTHTRISRVRRHLFRFTPRHFTLRRVCCSFEIYEIGCASPLTGSAAKRRDEFLHSLFAAFFFLPSSFVRMYVFMYPVLFLIFLSKMILVYKCADQYQSGFLILCQNGFDGSSDCYKF